MTPQFQKGNPGHFKDKKHGGPPYSGKGLSTFDQLPAPVPMNYFKDSDKKVFDPELVDAKALEWAKAFGPDLKSTQMRRFYDELKAIDRKIMVGKDQKEQQANFQRDRSLIVMFKAKAVYAEKRKVSPRSFTQFIFDHVASIHDLNDFHAFLKIFEAVVAFHKFFARDN